jgi:PiT family inorganic phosphate transporter
LQLLSATVYSISHGLNDAQKTMGIIALVFSAEDFWIQVLYTSLVVLACHTVIAWEHFPGDGGLSRRWG